MFVTDRTRRVSQYEKTCLIRGDGGRAIRDVLDRIANKWSVLVVATLDGRRLRFTELQRQIPGISQRMLSLTLKHLQRDGLISRTAYAEVPPRVEYELTDIGRTLIEPTVGLAEWAIEHNPAIAESRRRHDAGSRLGAD